MEQDCHYYDGIFKHSKMFRSEFQKSIYLPGWLKTTEWIGGINSILDIGCGTGQYAAFLSTKKKKVFRYHGIDFSEVAISLATQLRLPRSSFTFEKKDILTSNIDFTAYGVVLMLEFLEHINDDVLFLKRIPIGKRIVLSVPNFSAPSHVRHFSSLSDVINRYGSVLTINDTFSYRLFTSGASRIFLLNATVK